MQCGTTEPRLMHLLTLALEEKAMYKNLAKSWMHDKIVGGSSLGNSPEREEPTSTDCAKHVKEESWFDVDLTPLGKLLTEMLPA